MSFDVINYKKNEQRRIFITSNTVFTPQGNEVGNYARIVLVDANYGILSTNYGSFSVLPQGQHFGGYTGCHKAIYIKLDAGNYSVTIGKLSGSYDTFMTLPNATKYYAKPDNSEFRSSQALGGRGLKGSKTSGFEEIYFKEKFSSSSSGSVLMPDVTITTSGNEADIIPFLDGCLIGGVWGSFSSNPRTTQSKGYFANYGGSNENGCVEIITNYKF